MKKKCQKRCIMNEKGILKSGKTTLEKRDSDAVFRKCISNIWVISGTLLWDDFSGAARGNSEGASWK